MGSYVSMMAGRGILYNLVVQDYSQLKQYGDESDTILANMACTIYLRTTHPKTLEAISRATGKYTVLSASQSDSYKSSELSGTHQVSSSTNLMGRELLTPHEIGLFETPYALCLPGGNCFVSNLPDISNYDIHEELGMGSVEQNQELLMEAVNKRPLNPLIKPEPWNPYEKIVETVHPPEEKKKKEQQNPPEEEKDKNMTIHAADSKTSGKVLGTITESVFRQSHTVSPEENLFSEKADRKNKEAKEKREEEKQQ